MNLEEMRRSSPVAKLDCKPLCAAGHQILFLFLFFFLQFWVTLQHPGTGKLCAKQRFWVCSYVIVIVQHSSEMSQKWRKSTLKWRRFDLSVYREESVPASIPSHPALWKDPVFNDKNKTAKICGKMQKKKNNSYRLGISVLIFLIVLGKKKNLRSFPILCRTPNRLICRSDAFQVMFSDSDLKDKNKNLHPFYYQSEKHTLNK